MRILSIETSCDETSLAIIEANGGLRSPSASWRIKIQKHLIASQIETHRPWGGVVPNLAKREHANNLPLLFGKIVGISKSESLNPKQIPNSKFQIPNIDLIAVTVGPGLEPCLWQGIEFAKTIKKECFPKAKIVPTNHLHGHMYSFLLAQKSKFQTPNSKFQANSKFQIPNSKLFPAVQLLVSGGHTILLLMESLTKYKKLGETRDDAAGEAFDKVARMLGLPYPGGPEIERLASKYRLTKSIDFPRPMIHDKNYDFSFSGLKTSVLYYLRDHKRAKKYDVAASFQNAVIDVLTAKTLRAAKEYGAKSIILSGGVAANSALRKLMKLQAKSYKLNFLSADKKFQGDNAAMIAVAGYITHLHPPTGGKKYPLKANGNLNL